MQCFINYFNIKLEPFYLTNQLGHGLGLDNAAVPKLKKNRKKCFKIAVFAIIFSKTTIYFG